MRLKKLTVFQREAFEGRPPDIRTLRKWPGAIQIEGKWFMDLDVLAAHARAKDQVNELIARLVQNPLVAKAVDG